MHGRREGDGQRRMVTGRLIAAEPVRHAAAVSTATKAKRAAARARPAEQANVPPIRGPN